MNNKFSIFIAALILVSIGAGIWHSSHRQNTTALDQRLLACGSLTNGSTQTVSDTSRMFINLPKDLYPNVPLQITSHGATAGYVSNGGPYGSAMGAQGKPNCWSYYLEFDGIGTVDLTSLSGVNNIPDYTLHFVVASATSKPINTPSSGIVGSATLGPTCPVMRNPPDPQCADKPYQGNFILTSSNTAGIAKTFSTGLDGKFTVQVPPGKYTIQSASSSPYPRCSSGSIQVVAGAYASTSISCDTGIR